MNDNETMKSNVKSAAFFPMDKIAHFRAIEIIGMQTIIFQFTKYRNDFVRCTNCYH